MISYLPDISFYLSVHTEIIQHLTRIPRGEPENLRFFLINSKDLFVRKSSNSCKLQLGKTDFLGQSYFWGENAGCGDQKEKQTDKKYLICLLEESVDLGLGKECG